MIRLQVQNLSPVTHGFFGRAGGVSTGIFASLNCGPGSGDDRQQVTENRRRALAELTDAPEAHLLTLHQIHSAEAVTVERPWEMGQGPKADAMATNVPWLALGILTADCAPVLLADAQAGVIGAAHAGWKGALGGVLEATLEAMEKLGALRMRISAAIGPSISQKNYEVGADFRDRFLETGAKDERFFVPSGREGHFRFDLPGYVVHRLTQAGTGSVETLGICTYPAENGFFSFRRTTHAGEPDYGRQISAIVLNR